MQKLLRRIKSLRVPKQLTITLLLVFVLFGLGLVIGSLNTAHTALTTLLQAFPDQAYRLLNILLIAIGLVGGVLYSYIDYSQHIRPLRQEVPTIVYTPAHYMRVIFIPRAKYKLKDTILTITRLSLSSTIVLFAFTLGMFVFSAAAPGTLTVTINQKTGTADSNPSYTSVFTVQFSEPIDEATLTNSDITLGGTAPGQQVQSITEAGTFNKTTYEVRIQATSAGTIQPTIAQELITAQNVASGTNQASTSTDNSVTYNGDWAPGEFVTTWKTDDPEEQILILTASYPTLYDYQVDWGDGSISTGQTGNATHTYAMPGVYTVKITGDFPRIRFGGTSIAQKILSVEQWGTNPWTSMSNAFAGCSNLVINATDAPDLNNVNNMDNMFWWASSLNQSLNHWDVSHVTNMSYMFYVTHSFNQPLNSWDVGQVTNMSYMFAGTAFDQPIGNWNVSNVTDMAYMFSNSSFNQPINDWDVSHVQGASYMFFNASAFNQPLNSWDVSAWQGGSGVFQGAVNFNQPLDNWDTSNWTSTAALFAGASAFNQPLNSWDVSNVTDMAFTFSDASSFNQPLNNWNTGKVTRMWFMFRATYNFDQSLGNWDISHVTDMQDMFHDAGLSTSNYDATIIGWSSQSLRSNVAFGGGSSTYCSSETQRQSIINNYNWIIYDGGKDCGSPQRPFIIRVKTDNPGASNNNQFSFWIQPQTYTYNYNIDCDSDGVYEVQNGNGWDYSNICTYTTAGEYDISVTGDFPRFHNGAEGGCIGAQQDTDTLKIIDVKQWGDIEWQNMSNMFYCASNITTFSATDIPDLSRVAEMSGMFAFATNFDSNINNWDVSNVEDMLLMFCGTTSFNQLLNNWNVSNVTNMGGMFVGATSFNQPLGNWDVSNVTVMQVMFMNATSFNQLLNNWNVSNVTNMGGMFVGATSFDQSLASWDVSNVTMMDGMFGDFITIMKLVMEQDIGLPYDQWTQEQKDYFWNVIAPYYGYPYDEQSYIPDPSGLSTANYDATLIAWSAQSLESDVTFDAGSSKYCTAETHRQSTIDNHNWTINDMGKDCGPSQPGAVPSAPRNIVAEQSLLLLAPNYPVVIPDLSWQEPLEGAPISDYVIEYREKGNTGWQTINDGSGDTTSHVVNFGLSDYTTGDDPTPEQEAIINTLIDGMELEFRVAAVNEHGQGEYAYSNEFQTGVTASDCQSLHDNLLDAVPDGAYFMLYKDIDCSETSTWNGGQGWRAVSDMSSPYIGTFDGQGHTISNLKIDGTRDRLFYESGMFGVVEQSTIKDLDFTNATLNGHGGILASKIMSSATIQGISIKGEIIDIAGDTNASTGGLAGVVGMAEDNISIEDIDLDLDGSISGVAGMLVGIIDSQEQGSNTSINISNITVNGDIQSYGSAVGGVIGAIANYGYPNTSSHVSIQNIEGIVVVSSLSDISCIAGGIIGGIGRTVFDIHSVNISADISCLGGNYDYGNMFSAGGVVGQITQTQGDINDINITGSILIDIAEHPENIMSGGGIVGAVTNTINSETDPLQSIQNQGLIIGNSTVAVNVTSMQATSPGSLGGVVGTATALNLHNVHSSGSVTLAGSGTDVVSEYGGTFTLGGTVGYVVLAKVHNATSSSTVTSVYPEDQTIYSGGLIGTIHAYGQIDNSSSSGNVTSTRDIDICVSEEASIPGTCYWRSSQSTGGLVGIFGMTLDSGSEPSQINNSYATGNILVKGPQTPQFVTGKGVVPSGVGGLVGQTMHALGDLIVSGNYSTGTVSYQGNGTDIPTLGGLIGNAYDDLGNTLISNNYSTGDVGPVDDTSDAPPMAGGLVGNMIAGIFSGGEIIQEYNIYGNYATGDVTGEAVGGLVGEVIGTGVSNNYATGDVHQVYSPSLGGSFPLAFGGLAGGLVGYAGGNINNSYATGTVDASEAINIVESKYQPYVGAMPESILQLLTHSKVGGLVGFTGFPGLSGGITNSFSVGDVSAPDPTYASMLLGAASNMIYQSGVEPDFSNIIVNSYYAQTDLGDLPCTKIALAEEDNTISLSNWQSGCTDVDTDKYPNYFKNNSTNPPLNQWDFNSIWKVNCEYPIFTWQTSNCATIPSAPQNLHTTNITHNSITVAWSPPANDGGSPVTHYQVQYKRADSNAWISAPVQVSSYTNHQFINLTADTSYHIRVLAINAIGQSPPSNTINPRTLAPTTPTPTPTPTTPSGPTSSTPTTDTTTNQPAPGSPISPKPDQSTPTLPSTPSAIDQAKQPKQAPKTTYIPFAFISILLLIALAYALSAWQDYRRLLATKELLAHYELLGTNITAFLGITAHYLNTPVAILKNSLEIMTKQSLIPHEVLAKLRTQTNELGGFVAGVQHNNTSLSPSSANNQSTTSATVIAGNGSASRPSTSPADVLRSKPVWIPLLVIAISVAAIDIIFILQDAYTAESLRVLNHIVAYGLGMVLLVCAFYLHRKQQILKQEQATLVANKKALLDTKQSVLGSTAAMLNDHYTTLNNTSTGLRSQHPNAAKTFLNGLDKLGSIAQSLAFAVKHTLISNPNASTILSSPINTVAARYLSVAQTRNIIITTDVPANLTVGAYDEHIAFITEQLLDNAVKFSPDNSPVTIQATRAGKFVKLSIADQGPGLSETAQAKLFEPFSRGTDNLTFNNEGIGIGLYNTKLLVDSLGGSIKLYSNKPHGLVAEVKLPARAIQQPSTSTMYQPAIS